jgi:hypothetical protein
VQCEWILNRRNQRPRSFRTQQAGGVLDVQAIDVGRCGEPPRAARIEGIVVHGAHGIRESSDDFRAAFGSDQARAIQQRIHVVHGIDHRETGQAIRHQSSVHQTHELSVCGLPSNEPQPGGNELQPRVGHRGMHQAYAFPGIFPK